MKTPAGHGAPVPVEVMVHPGWEDERAYLLSAGWKRLIEGHRLGSYADLSGSRQ